MSPNESESHILMTVLNLKFYSKKFPLKLIIYLKIEFNKNYSNHFEEINLFSPLKYA